MFRLPLFAIGCLLMAASVRAATTEKVQLRGQPIALTIYTPATPARGTILMGSGDVGWVGLAASLAEEFSGRGYIVVGINVRLYLSTFTSGKSHVETTDEPADYRTIAEFLAARHLLVHPVVAAGVSEGAALAVLAASDPKNHQWLDGVITMGLPASAELAWRWTDAASWITKRDANEPSFSPQDVIARVAPLPLYMIQSKKDEYVTPADYERFRTLARAPSQLVLIDASNHRFTDRRPQLDAAFTGGLAWIAQLRAAAP
jgi:alpha-beta hydrolase superfamily lysophospholipase